MARRKLGDRDIRKLVKKGTSYTVTLPIEGIREFKWQKGQKLTVEIDTKRKRMIVKDWE